MDHPIYEFPSGPIAIVGRGIDVLGTDGSRIIKWKKSRQPRRRVRFVLPVKDVEFQLEDRDALIHGW